ncbi:DUF5677 domain-containing protein [Rhizobium helianthi]|uniref:DUF5677 domain-containing protein n=1 Tax=Rhizobium helianthi TaxID=1132695 RepID=A0ABW4M393_9HYPH
MGGSAIRFLVDETAIVAAHDRMIASDEDLSRHLDHINSCLDFLSRLPELHTETNEDELTLLRLSIRCFNSGASALRLLRCGYFQPAMTMVRDLIEIYFLMDLFTKQPQSFRDWRTMSEKERKKHFKPIRVRERLDEIDGFKEKKRQKSYDMLSHHAAHVNPNGHQLISPGNMTQIGPFPDYGLFRAGFEELATHLGFASVVVCNLVKTDREDALRVKAAFLTNLGFWKDRYLA